MTSLPHPWDAYAHFQQKLAHKSYSNNQAWGLEIALSRILTEEIDTKTIDRITRSAGRKERNRSVLRRLHPANEESIRDSGLINALDARERLRTLEALTTPEDWSLLLSVAEGYEYTDISPIMKSSPTALRTRVSRLRRRLASVTEGT